MVFYPVLARLILSKRLRKKSISDADIGSYLFIETSAPRKMGDHARLISSVLTIPGTYCLRCKTIPILNPYHHL